MCVCMCVCMHACRWEIIKSCGLGQRRWMELIRCKLEPTTNRASSEWVRVCCCKHCLLCLGGLILLSFSLSRTDCAVLWMQVRKALLGQFRASRVPPKKKVWEFRVTKNALVRPGTHLYAAHFVPGQYVDVCAKRLTISSSASFLLSFRFLSLQFFSYLFFISPSLSLYLCIGHISVSRFTWTRQVVHSLSNCSCVGACFGSI